MYHIKKPAHTLVPLPLPMGLKEFVHACYGLEGVKTQNDKMPMGLPIALQRKHVRTIWGLQDHYTQYVVSPKADGIRVNIGCIGETTFITGRDEKFHAAPFTCHANAYNGTLVDAEHVLDTNRMWLFDVMRLNGHADIRSKPYHHRLHTAQVFLKQMAQQDGYTMEEWKIKPQGDVVPFPYFVVFKDKKGREWRLGVKPIWYHPDVAKAVRWAEAFGIPQDGLIYTPVTREVACYRSEDLLKHKEPHMHTVDFVVRNVPQNHDMMGLWVTGNSNQLELYCEVPLRCQDSKMQLQIGKVYECASVDGQWVVIKRRLDKTLPNARLTVERTCENIREGIRWQELIPRPVV